MIGQFSVKMLPKASHVSKKFVYKYSYVSNILIKKLIN